MQVSLLARHVSAGMVSCHGEGLTHGSLTCTALQILRAREKLSSDQPELLKLHQGTADEARLLNTSQLSGMTQ